MPVPIPIRDVRVAMPGDGRQGVVAEDALDHEDVVEPARLGLHREVHRTPGPRRRSPTA